MKMIYCNNSKKMLEMCENFELNNIIPVMQQDIKDKLSTVYIRESVDTETSYKVSIKLSIDKEQGLNNYINYHNSKTFEYIMMFNANKIIIDGDDGEVIITIVIKDVNTGELSESLSSMIYNFYDENLTKDLKIELTVITPFTYDSLIETIITKDFGKYLSFKDDVLRDTLILYSIHNEDEYSVIDKIRLSIILVKYLSSVGNFNLFISGKEFIDIDELVHTYCELNNTSKTEKLYHDIYNALS